MNNRVFSVNGSGSDKLLATIKLAFNQDFTPFMQRVEPICKGWAFNKEKGLILLSYFGREDNVNVLPDMTADQVFPLVEAWLKSDEAKSVEKTGWDRDLDHDGHNTGGWRVYVEDDSDDDDVMMMM